MARGIALSVLAVISSLKSPDPWFFLSLSLSLFLCTVVFTIFWPSKGFHPHRDSLSVFVGLSDCFVCGSHGLFVTLTVSRKFWCHDLKRKLQKLEF